MTVSALGMKFLELVSPALAFAPRIILLCPHRRALLNDRRTMRRCTKRWKIERTFAHLGNFRRLLIRQDRLLTSYRAFAAPKREK
jgi:transposase